VVVDLGSGGPDDVGAAVAAAVGAPPPGEGGGADGDEPLARAVAVLARREVLVVLDGCEHVRTEAAQAAVDLLAAGPGVRILATSQVPLGVAGEAVVALAPLPVPPAGAGTAAIRRSAAVELLARRLDELACPLADDADWEHAGAIVRALDGLPLAIEIAAAAARTEPLGVLARRLAADTSTMLDAEPPVGAGRRRLGAALDAAVDRLGADAARVYALLSVFPGGFDTAGAAAVAGIDEADARAVTGRLAEASLVVLEGPGRQRARLLRPVRAHAAARLGAQAAAEAHERLVAWCLTLAAELDEAVHSPDQAQVIGRFGAELPSLRLVLRHLLDVGDIARAAALFEDLVSCWVDSPASPEALAWADELLAQADRLPAGPRARLEVAAIHAQYAFELIAARLDLAEQALGHAEAAGDRFATAAAQVQVAIGLGWRNADLDRAAALIDESRATMLDLGASYWSAVVLELRGLLALRRLDVAEGIATLEAAAAEHQRHGGPGDVAHALTFIGYARRAVGDLSGARRAFDEAGRALGEVRVTTWLRATVGAAHAALALGDVAAAGAAFRGAHDRAVEIGDGRIVGTALVGLAAVARHEGADDRSVALLVAAADRALSGGDPTDAVTAAGLLAEMLVARGAHDEAAVLLGAATLVDDEVGVRVDFGLAHDLGPVRAAVVASVGEHRAADLGGDGRVIGLAAAVRRAGEWLLDDAGFTLLDDATPGRPDGPATPAIPLPRSRSGRVTPAS
jgi:predicted ATPase